MSIHGFIKEKLFTLKDCLAINKEIFISRINS